MNQSPIPEVVVAVLTFRRNDQIAALIPLLAQQIRDAAALCRARLVVVDNDGGAAEVVNAALEQIAEIPARYVHERQPGLVAARNRALAEARGAAALVFIDDDERPGAGWLRLLVATWLDTQAWAVSGPVRSEFEVAPDDWVRGSELFARTQARTGSQRRSAATNNLLIDLDQIEAAGLRFDDRFSATGGEDSFFAQELRSRGGSIIWCDEAEVSETVPAARLSHDWVRLRSMRFGETWAFVRVLLCVPGLRRTVLRLRYLMRGLALLVGHGLLAGFALARRDRYRQGRHASRAWGGWGICRGALGRRYQEYRR